MNKLKNGLTGTVKVELIKPYSKEGVVGGCLDFFCPKSGTPKCSSKYFVDGGSAKQAGLYKIKCHYCGYEWEIVFDPRDSDISSVDLSKDICKHCIETKGYFWTDEDDELFDEGNVKCPHLNCVFELEHIMTKQVKK